MTGFSSLSASTVADMLEQSAGGDPITPDAPTTPPDGFYGEMQVAAAEMLADFMTGSVVLVKEDVTASTDDNPFAQDNITRNNLTVAAVVLGYSADRIDGQQIQVGDVRVICDATDIVNRPKKGHTIKIDSVPFILQDVKPIPAAGTTSAYIFQARSGN